MYDGQRHFVTHMEAIVCIHDSITESSNSISSTVFSYVGFQLFFRLSISLFLSSLHVLPFSLLPLPLRPPRLHHFATLVLRYCPFGDIRPSHPKKASEQLSIRLEVTRKRHSPNFQWRTTSACKTEGYLKDIDDFVPVRLF